MDSSTPLEAFIDSLRPAFEAGDPGATQKVAESDCVALVEAMYQAVARGDFAAFLDALADDVELENVGPSSLLFVGKWKGRNEVGEAVRRNFSQLSDQRPVVISVIAQGDTVVISAHERGTFLPTGKEYDVNWVQFFTWSHRRLVRFRQVCDPTGFLAAAAVE